MLTGSYSCLTLWQLKSRKGICVLLWGMAIKDITALPCCILWNDSTITIFMALMAYWSPKSLSGQNCPPRRTSLSHCCSSSCPVRPDILVATTFIGAIHLNHLLWHWKHFLCWYKDLVCSLGHYDIGQRSGVGCRCQDPVAMPHWVDGCHGTAYQLSC